MVATQSLFAVALMAFTGAQGASLQQRSTSGRATFYDVGLGNCGWSNSGSENVVALNTAQYGSTSQKSSHCGQMLTINYNGKSAQAKVVDSCPTCPYGALDLSKSLFSQLTGGNLGLGEIQVQWSWGSGSSNSGSSNQSNDNKKSSSSSNNNKSNNDDNKNKSQNKSSNNDSKSSSSSSSSSSKSTPTPTHSSSSESSAPSSTSSPSSSAAAPAVPTPSGSADKTVTGVPVWWATIGTEGCDAADIPQGADQAAIAASDNAEEADLSKHCGKWIEITNTDNKKTTKAVVSSWLPGADRDSITLADAYTKVADMNGNVPAPVAQVAWGFI